MELDVIGHIVRQLLDWKEKAEKRIDALEKEVGAKEAAKAETASDAPADEAGTDGKKSRRRQA